MFPCHRSGMTAKPPMALGEADEDVARLRKDLTDPKRSAKTTEEYTQALVRLHRKLGSPEPVWRVDKWARISAVLPILKKLRHTTAKTNVAMLLVALRRWPQARQAWMPAWHEICDRVERRVNKGVKSARESENWVTRAEVHAKIHCLDAELQGMQRATSIDQRRVVLSHLALCMLTMLPALRTQNLADIRRVASEDDAAEGENFLVRKDGRYTLVLNAYKTAASYGKQRIKFPESLNAVVARSFRLFPRRFLICQLRSPELGMCSNTVTKFLSRVFEHKRVRCTLMRKLWVSEFYKAKPSLQQKCRLAGKMLHSVQVAQAHYNKQR